MNANIRNIIVGVQTFDKGTIPTDGTQGVTLSVARTMAQELGRKAEAFFQQLSCYEHCTEAMRLREYTECTNDTEKIAKRVLKLLKEIESAEKSPIVQRRAGNDKGKLIFSGMERYKCFFLNIV